MDRDVVIAASVVLVAGIATAVMVVRHPRQPERTAIVLVEPAPAAPPATAPARLIPLPAPEVIAPPAPIAPPAAPPPAPARRGRRPAQTITGPIDEPLAREALAWIGSDPAADAVWVAAINDPNLTPGQRRNLIEDLNETGFDNPRNLTSTDLPVIEYRLALINRLANDAMDDVNAAAFQEAYRDLVNMRNRVAQQ